MSRRKRTTRRRRNNVGQNFGENFGGVVTSPPSPSPSVTEITNPTVTTTPTPRVETTTTSMPSPQVEAVEESTETATPDSTGESVQDSTLVEEAAVGAAAGAAAGAGVAAAGAGAGAGAGAALPSDATMEEARAVYIYLNPEGMTNQITTQANDDPAYHEIGIIHVTDSAAINVARGFVTNVSNFFGAKGFDNTVFDLARNGALNQMKMLMSDTQKVCNLRMETSNDPTLVFVHLYGTLLAKV
jgi:hypothetical protein